MAFTNTWNAAFEAQPADVENVSLGASRIRSHKLAVRERLIIDHSWAGDADDGKHKQIIFVDPLPSDPANVVDEGMLYTKNVSAKVELFWKDEDGNVIQLTTIGKINTSTAIVGEIRMWSTGTAPSLWLDCDGAAVSRTTYTLLFAVIGTTFGVGDGSTTFNLPDFRGRVPVGVGTGDASDATAHALADKEGTETHTLVASEIPAHTHPLDDAPTSAGGSVRFGLRAGGSGNTTGLTGGGGSHNNLQPSLTIHYMIHAGV